MCVNASTSLFLGLGCSLMALAISAFHFAGPLRPLPPIEVAFGIAAIHGVYSIGWGVFGAALALLLRSLSSRH